MLQPYFPRERATDSAEFDRGKLNLAFRALLDRWQTRTDRFDLLFIGDSIET
jgi:hypothetical protein